MPVASNHLLIICDHPFLCHSLTRLVQETSDLQVRCTAKDAAGAREAILHCRPDLAVVDIAGKTSRLVELVRELHAEYPELPILAVSSHCGPGGIREVIKAGALDFVAESEAPTRLASTARRLLSENDPRK